MSSLLECVFENCTRKFDKKWRLDEHLCSHTGTFLCLFYPSVILNSYFLHAFKQIHLSLVLIVFPLSTSGERPFICTEPGCDKSFVRKAHLQRHTFSHSDERPFSCSICNSAFKVLSNLRKHEKIHAGKKPYTCHVVDCDSAFLKKTQLYSHLLSEHAVSTPFKCEVCNTNFTTQSHLNRHTQNQHLSRFMCTDCYQIFDKFSALQKHLGKAHKKKPHCAQCSLTFSSHTNLNSHISKVHFGNETACSSSQSSVELRTEVITPDQLVKAPDTRSDTCSVDSSVGYYSVQYSDDVDDIFEEEKTAEETDASVPEKVKKSFECATCHKTFSSKAVLTKHMKSVHNTINVTEFKCSECAGIFKSKSNIVKHIQSKHKGIKRFNCALCPMKFYYKAAFERHIATIHSGKVKEPQKAWNKTTLVEDISGHFVDDKVKRYVENMRELGFKKRKVQVEDGDVAEQTLRVAGS